MKEHSGPPFMPESHQMVGCASCAAPPYHPQIVVKEWGLLLSLGTLGVHFEKVPQLRGHLRGSEVFPLLSKLGCPHWSVPDSIPLVAGGETEVTLSPGLCGCLSLWVNAPGKVPTSEPGAVWMVVFAHLVLGAWEPLLAWVSVAISVPPVCWENVRTSPDLLQSQELHCLNLCQLCF